MGLIKAVLQRVVSQTDTQQPVEGKYVSPPPEIDANVLCKRITRKRKKRVHEYDRIAAKVDSSVPRLYTSKWYRNLQQCGHDMKNLHRDNIRLLMFIRKAQLLKGRVDSHWRPEPCHSLQYYRNRVDFLTRIHKENLDLYKRITTTRCRVASTAELNQQWVRNKGEIINRAVNKFVLFPPVPHQEIEDAAFVPPPGVKRPRVCMTIGIQNSSALGELCIELFTDVCPETCKLFTELLMGDKLGHSYVGTCFFRKVPQLYWSGGDVTHNNGFGCYAQRGRVKPVGAENYHFSHSMPGLVSMRVTCDDEVCGIFNITFKPLPQFDVRGVVFGRIIRPSITYDTARMLGKALSTYPVVDIRSSRRKHNGRWLTGKPNTRLIPAPHTKQASVLRQ